MRICCVTSCNRSMSSSWSLMNAFSMAICVGEVSPFMLSVAILRESIYLPTPALSMPRELGLAHTYIRQLNTRTKKNFNKF
jgi:hypothetical protein